MRITFEKVKESPRSAHVRVLKDGLVVGEVWREQASVVISKLTAPRKMATRWRWFARKTGESTILGRGTRSAMLLGAGYPTKMGAIDVLIDVQGLELTQGAAPNT